MTTIVPAILATTEEEYKQKLDRIKAGPELAEGWVQIDLMDNKFVQNRSIGPDVLVKYPANLSLEAQLMVEYPENWIDELIKIPVARIIFPVEDTEGVEERIKHIKNHGVQVGLSLNPDTGIEAVEPFIQDLDAVLVMSVHPGFGGQEFIPEVLPKIKNLKEMKSNLIVGVDGGISPENAKLVSNAGADYLVVGSHLMEGEISKNLEKFQEAINGKSK